MARDPRAGAERVRGRIDRQRDARALRETGRSTEDLYPLDRDWNQHLHEAVGYPWPCPFETEPEHVYSDVMAMFRAEGLPERYAGWCDGSRDFTRAAWCLTLHLKPSTVVETGVARGVTSRLILEALERNGDGHLWSIDLPSIDPRLHTQMGISVSERLHDRWSFLQGTSRKHLPRLLATLGEIDLFVHDSLHTGRNTRFELDHAWRVLKPGGVMLVDDVYQSLACRQFVDATGPAWWLVASRPDGNYRFGIVGKGSCIGPS